ncbi:MAG: efflux RND transporter periplasmic adaptor subunit [Planctomycetota bacterium]|jgi:Cu(I)/Ag(I) efflux system membrane fusion protein
MSGIDVSSLLQRVPGGGKTVLVVVIAFCAGFLLRGGDSEKTVAPVAERGSHVKWYTCSMHPQIKLQDPNARCPICGMELIPVTEESGDDGAPRRLSMSEAAKALAEVETAPVERRFVIKEVPLVGKIDYDETSQQTITAWVPGRLDRLHVDYTGVAVRKGAPLVYMYSPELLQAQSSLLEADRAYEEMKGTTASEANLKRQGLTINAIEEQLRLWGLTVGQLAKIRKRGTASDHMTILSPIAGIVTAKKAVEGDWVRVGTKIYEIADLSLVWVYLDAYESDLAWIKYAQEVEFEAEAYPGEIFRGRISFIHPFLNEMTRTVPVRVTVDNVDGRLKPGMFVRARIHARLAEAGKIVEPFLAGKWISPVHPEVVEEEPGECRECGTPLVSAESLGYVGEDAPAPLVIPATAPLRTGKRAVVYVEVPNAERPTYDGREILLGPRTRNHYLVRQGLEEGERVVVKGNFKIDSALQILARPSMMSPSDEDERTEEPALRVPASFVAALNPLYHAYLEAQRALAADDLALAKQALAATARAAEGVDTSRVSGRLREAWNATRLELTRQARQGAEAAAMAQARAAFESLSKPILQTVRAFGQATEAKWHEVFCPMAFDNQGASWLQEGDEIRNPYFGAKMLACGEIRDTFAPKRAAMVPASFRGEISTLVDKYLAISEALAQDSLEAAQGAAAAFGEALAGVRSAGLEGEVREAWRDAHGNLRSAVESMRKAVDLEGARRPFALLSDGMIRVLKRFGHAGPDDLVQAHCPMAFSNRGADWIQRGDNIRNPFFGAAMLRCGDVTHRFASEPGD